MGHEVLAGAEYPALESGLCGVNSERIMANSARDAEEPTEVSSALPRAEQGLDGKLALMILISVAFMFFFLFLAVEGILIGHCGHFTSSPVACLVPCMAVAEMAVAI